MQKPPSAVTLRGALFPRVIINVRNLGIVKEKVFNTPTWDSIGAESMILCPAFQVLQVKLEG
jgi:hypothetical protein